MRLFDEEAELVRIGLAGHVWGIAGDYRNLRRGTRSRSNITLGRGDVIPRTAVDGVRQETLVHVIPIGRDHRGIGAGGRGGWTIDKLRISSCFELEA